MYFSSREKRHTLNYFPQYWICLILVEGFMMVECWFAGMGEMRLLSSFSSHFPPALQSPLRFQYVPGAFNLIAKSNIALDIWMEREIQEWYWWLYTFFFPLSQPSPLFFCAFFFSPLGYLALQETVLPAANSSLLLRWWWEPRTMFITWTALHVNFVIRGKRVYWSPSMSWSQLGTDLD